MDHLLIQPYVFVLLLHLYKNFLLIIKEKKSFWIQQVPIVDLVGDDDALVGDKLGGVK